MDQRQFHLPDFSTIDEAAYTLGYDAPVASRPEGDPIARVARALAVFRNRAVSTEKLVRMAGEVVGQAYEEKETFVPLFTTNYCDSECKMCGMRQGNEKLIRKFSGKRLIEEQLHVLREHEGVRAVGFLTGEYLDAYTRRANAFLIGWAIHRAFELGFQRAYFNIGSLVPAEIEVLAEWIEPDFAAHVTMCVFQETYNVKAYARFMGTDDKEIPKANFDRRIRSFDHWLDAGFRQVNPGFLVGLHDVEQDLAALLWHVNHLEQRGGDVSVSLPRLRPALGSAIEPIVPDDEYIRLIATAALHAPQCRIVLTTREDQAFQDRVLPIIGTISPGSPDVSPYRAQGEIPNDAESSQFLIPDHRHPKEILSRIVSRGVRVKYFDPPEPATIQLAGHAL